MRKTIYAALLLSVAGLMGLTSCGSSSKTDSATVAADTVAVSSVDDILTKTDSLVGKTVQVEGVCMHICQHGGKKIFLMGSDENSVIRVDAGEKIGSFPKDAVNSVVVVTGTVVEERVDEAAILQMEEQYKQATLEKHGEQGGASCSADSKAIGENPADSFAQRMESFRNKIAERQAKEGKNYLSFYSILADKYEIK